jgi:hypothetical protein
MPGRLLIGGYGGGSGSASGSYGGGGGHHLKTFGSNSSLKVSGSSGTGATTSGAISTRPVPGSLATGMTVDVAEDGCPILKVPRMPFWGSDGEYFKCDFVTDQKLKCSLKKL